MNEKKKSMWKKVTNFSFKTFLKTYKEPEPEQEPKPEQEPEPKLVPLSFQNRAWTASKWHGSATLVVRCVPQPACISFQWSIAMWELWKQDMHRNIIIWDLKKKIGTHY